MKKNNCFIVIVTYNGSRYIKKCLDSVDGYDIIVVDNASSDDTCDIILKLFPEVELIKSNKNLGFGQANNLGIKKAIDFGCDYVFLLNQDAYLQKDTIPKLINAHSKNTNYAILSPIHLNGKGNRLDRNFSYYMAYDKNCDFFSDYIMSNQFKEIYEVPFVNAAAWLLPRNTLKLIGGFDPLFFHYGEDDNYCQKVKHEGLKIGVIPNAYVQHDREGIIKRPINSIQDKIKKEDLKFKLKFSNLNTRLISKPFSISIWIKVIMNISKGNFANAKLLYSQYFASRRAYEEARISRKKFENRDDYLYL